MKEGEKVVVVCDACFNIEEALCTKEKYNCGKCGKEKSVLPATSMAGFAFSLGKGAVNHAIAKAIMNNLKSQFNLSEFRIKLNILHGGITLDLIDTIINADLVSRGNVSSEAIYRQGLYVLKNLVKKQKNKLRENIDTGMDIDNRWISLILKSTFKNEFINGNPQFGYIIPQKLRQECLGKKFLLYPGGVTEHSFHSPIMPEEFKADMINEGSVEAFKKMYDLYTFGNMEVALKKLENILAECYVPEVAVFNTPAVLLLPEKRRAYIFHL